MNQSLTLHTNQGNIIAMNCLLIAEDINVEIAIKTLKPINLKEKIYKKSPSIFP